MTWLENGQLQCGMMIIWFIRLAAIRCWESYEQDRVKFKYDKTSECSHWGRWLVRNNHVTREMANRNDDNLFREIGGYSFLRSRESYLSIVHNFLIPLSIKTSFLELLRRKNVLATFSFKKKPVSASSTSLTVPSSRNTHFRCCKNAKIVSHLDELSPHTFQALTE